jgi:hypothetical protein
MSNKLDAEVLLDLNGIVMVQQGGYWVKFEARLISNITEEIPHGIDIASLCMTVRVSVSSVLTMHTLLTRNIKHMITSIDILKIGACPINLLTLINSLKIFRKSLISL